MLALSRRSASGPRTLRRTEGRPDTAERDSGAFRGSFVGGTSCERTLKDAPLSLLAVSRQDAYYDRSRGHGRLEIRVVKTLAVTGLGIDFPYAAQVARIVRHRTDTKTGKRTRENVYVIPDLTSRQATPERIAKIIRSCWVIENRLHFVCDTAFYEDASQVRTGHGSENVVTLRSFAINQLRAAGHTNIAAALREMSLRLFERPLNLLGLS
ncbi:ISAs1 family transposase [Streptomyces sp. CG1]|uniref:ISAs1 family transposase n=1 Tax=Streptomyces sp. CG1 TaxID=1287523 RepID=UPI0034E1CB76